MLDLNFTFKKYFSILKFSFFIPEMGVLSEIARAVEEMDWT
jgi:hypothetical protein